MTSVSDIHLPFTVWISGKQDTCVVEDNPKLFRKQVALIYPEPSIC